MLFSPKRESGTWPSSSTAGTVQPRAEGIPHAMSGDGNDASASGRNASKAASDHFEDFKLNIDEGSSYNLGGNGRGGEDFIEAASIVRRGAQDRSLSGSTFYKRHAPTMLHTVHGEEVQESEVLLGPFHYIKRFPGKNMRRALLDAFNVWLKVPEDTVNSISVIIDKLHNASLLVDDIEDNSKLRRGAPVAHAVYGVAMTLNCANFVYFEAFHDALQLGNSDIVKPFLDELLKLHRGQGRDIYYRDHFICPSEEEYVDMVLDKTAGLFRLAVSLLQCFSEDKRDYTNIINDLGLLYQVLDDYLNLRSGEYHANKSFCEDLTEGKFSFPIIHHVRNSRDTRVLNILRQRPEEREVKKYAVDCMKETDSFDYTLKYVQNVQSRLLKTIGDMGGNKPLTKIAMHWLSKAQEVEKEG